MKNARPSERGEIVRATLLAIALGIVAACGDSESSSDSEDSGGASGRTGSGGTSGAAGRTTAGTSGTTTPVGGAGGGDEARGGAEDPGAAGDGGSTEGGSTSQAGGGSRSEGGVSGGNPAAAGAAGAGGKACSEGDIGEYTEHSGDVTWPVRSYYCDLYRLCCREACFDTDGLAECESTYPTDGLEAALDAGTATVNEENLAACMEALRARATDCEAALTTTNSLFEDSGIPACANAVAGTVLEGDRCDNDFECADDSDPAFCIRPDDGYGFCVVARKGQLGDPCFMTEATLTWPGGSRWISAGDWVSGATRCLVQDGLYCNDEARCFQLLPEGAACSPGQCAEGLYCRDTCQPLKATDEPCTVDERCAEGTCVDGLCSTNRVEESFCVAEGS